MNRLKNSYSTCMSCGGKKMKSGGNWIKSAIKKPGSFTAQAKKAGMSVPAFRDKVLSNKGAYSSTTVKRANLAKTLAGMRKGADGMNVTKRDLRAVSDIPAKGIGAASSMGTLTTPTPIESPANWYNESTWDKAMSENAARPAVGSPVQTSTSSSSSTSSGLVKGGSEKVRAYQEMLRSKGFDIKADGAWGPKTQAAYESYIKSKTSPAANSVVPAKTTSKASSENWNYTPEQWDKSMAENRAREAQQNMKSFNTTVTTPIKPAYVNTAISNAAKYKASKSANAKKYVMDKLNQFNKKS